MSEEILEEKTNLLAATAIAEKNGFVSTSMLQRAMGLGYSKAARIIDTLEYKGVIEAVEGNGKRKFIKST